MNNAATFRAGMMAYWINGDMIVTVESDSGASGFTYCIWRRLDVFCGKPLPTSDLFPMNQGMSTDQVRMLAKLAS